MEETRETRPNVVPSHYHYCDRCKETTPGYREKSSCNDPKFRTCSRCLAALFPENGEPNGKS